MRFTLPILPAAQATTQQLCHAKAMKRQDRHQVGTTKGTVGHHGRGEHNPWPGISKHGHAKIEMPVIGSGDELLRVLREQGPAPYIVPDRVTAPSVDW